MASLSSSLLPSSSSFLFYRSYVSSLFPSKRSNKYFSHQSRIQILYLTTLLHVYTWVQRWYHNLIVIVPCSLDSLTSSQIWLIEGKICLNPQIINGIWEHPPLTLLFGLTPHRQLAISKIDNWLYFLMKYLTFP